MKFALKSLFASVLVAAAAAGQAAVVPIDAAAALGDSRTITFSEVALGSTNPTYDAATSATGVRSAGVSFGSFFAGQSIGGVATCAQQITQCVLGNPTAGAPLTLVNVLSDGTRATTVNEQRIGGVETVLAGGGLTDGLPIAILFAEDVSAFSFTVGGFNNLRSTQIQVFSASGGTSLITPVTNGGTCPVAPCPPEALDPASQFLTFAFGDSAGVNSIRGILISLVGVEENGFAIDNVRSLVSDTTTPPPTTPPGSQVPEPGTLALAGLALLGLATSRRRAKLG